MLVPPMVFIGGGYFFEDGFGGGDAVVLGFSRRWRCR